jgi:hypothetical protein
MPAEINLEITGLALCFLRRPPAPNPAGTQEVWNVIFVCDDAHPLHFAQGNTPFPDLRRVRQDLSLRFICDFGPNPPSASPSDAEFIKLLNVSDANYAHGGASGKSNLKFERKPRPATGPCFDMVWMEVPHSTMTISGSEDCFILQTTPKSGKPNLVRACGKKVTLTFSVNTNFTIQATVFNTNDLPVPSASYSFDIDHLGSPITLSFDNGCGGSCDHNDFSDLYEVFVHKDEQNRDVQFTTFAKSLVQGLEGILVREEDQKLLDIDALIEKVRSGEFGNCDPLGSKPPPTGP